MLSIKVVGPNCVNCNKLYQMCNEVIEENNLDAEIEKIDDPDKFVELGVWITPALIVNGQLLLQGKLPTKSTLTHWLEKGGR